MLTVVLEGGFTKAEQSLHRGGHDAEVSGGRSAMHSVVEEELRDAVERILRRRVRCYMSANDPAEGVSCEIFVLHPAAGGEEASPSLNGGAAADENPAGPPPLV